MAEAVHVFPTSFAQRRLWFLEQLTRGQPVYHVADDIDFDWAVDPVAFGKAVALVVGRHDALRTTFSLVDGEPVQVVRDSLAPAIVTHDLTRSSEQAIERQLADITAALHDAPFDLERGPLLRLALVHTAADASTAIVVAHHIITDGWSSDVFAEELVLACEAVRTGHEPPWPAIGVQYSEYAVWQRRQAELGQPAHLSWWTGQLRDAPAALSLPIERARPPVPAHAGASLAFRLPAALTPALRSTAQRSNATLFMASLAAFEYLLSQVCGVTDLVIGTPVAGRPRAEVHRTLGLFVNTLALRLRIPEAPTFTRLLESVRDVAVEAFARQEVPFEHVVAAVAPDRQAAPTPLFQVMFTFDAQDEHQEHHGGVVQALEIDPAVETTAKFEITLALTETPAGVQGVLEFDADVFSPATMTAWLRHYHALLERVSREPDTVLDAAALMSPADVRVLEAINRTTTAYPREATIGSLFAEVAAAAGDAPAIVDRDRQVSYRELDVCSAALAARLRALGVERGALVAVSAERSIEFVVALVAIVKCGAAYVPLDPDYPQDRLRLMVDDTGVAAIVTGRGHQAWLAELGTPLVPVLLGETSSDASTPGAGDAASAHDTAYVVYTSGSTGRPKGVAVPHRAVVRLVRGSDYVSLGPGDVVAHASNTSFDAATFEVWGALLNGALLSIIPRDVALSPDEFVAMLRATHVSTLFLTTALFNQMAARDPRAFAGIRDLLFGGDTVDPGMVRLVLRGGAPPARLLHVYGPTETTTFATWHLVREVPDRATTVPIGRPIANSTAYVLDGAGRPVPIGVPGELYLGGDGVALGYLGQAEATAARFVAHPARPSSGERLYRSGDLVRWNADGALEFIGRRDRQVKVRGFRVEPAEIEIALAECDGVAQVAVVPREGAAGRYLAAYLAGPPDAPPAVERVRAYARDRLPAYMVPSAMVVLATLPLNANGKIDRDALPDVADAEAAPRADVVPPRNALEEAVAGVWRAVLQRDAVSVHDNFFDLGGHSLLIIQVLERLRPIAGADVGVVDLFRFPTIAALSAELHQRRAPAGDTLAALVAPPAIDDRAAKLRRAFTGSARS